MEKLKKLPKKSNERTTKEDDLTMSTIDNVSLEAPKLQEVVEGVSDIEVGDAIASRTLDDADSQSHSSSFKYPDLGGNYRSRSDSGVVTVVNSKKFGKRVTFPAGVIDSIGNPPGVKLGFDDNCIEVIPEHKDITFLLKVQGKKRIIYSAGLVDYITDAFQLDFSDKVSLTFYDIEYVRNHDLETAIIKVREPKD